MGGGSRRIHVGLADRSYDIVIEPGALSRLGELVSPFLGDGRALVVSDKRVQGLYGAAVSASLRECGAAAREFVVGVGERSKSLATLSRAYDAMVDSGLSRESLVVALGGGVVGDLAGFAAATYMRGVACVQVPTTLLAMVDSSVGGKAAVNHRSEKNIVGAFCQPKLVLCDPEVLRSLPRRELLCGLAEAVKHGVIRDAAYLREIEAEAQGIVECQEDLLTSVVTGSCRIKSAVVEADEREAGLRRILNYGHTFAHGIEGALSFRRLRHGEAVAVGMVAAGELAVSLGMLEASCARRIRDLLKRIGLPTSVEGVDVEVVLGCMRRDKKASGAGVRLVLARGIGEVEVVSELAESELRRALGTVLGQAS